ncbi:arylamine N-acetyltransferase [Pantoea sp. CS_6]|uniref:arylamine N-acetyltransferase family protein n=1 Tax=Pantoea TaxID=53335 RepID=UPI000736402D|nr:MULTISPECIES: arylamine N-acetyltransferase [Pantoea]KTS26976.1 hypothetical protein NS381_14325 [Pantoea stewartii]MDK2635738.1 arylamine N-acetyltransferase [Pantoea stewartii subsp. indologenes]NRH25153.1 hypothetical protein [Pantoea stewartii]PXV74570.1 N-hydroxyarylamine O-acetyltransferase [Pantoea sp. PNA 03-3]QIE97112.1 arylamine N-acetyltransferase [Pantoea stewartii]
MPETVTALSPALTERILDKLGLDHSPAPDAAGLQALYRAWCQKVPFDNIRRRILANDPPSQPLPGTTADDFFTHWLQFGTGGTCWAGHGALFALLMQLGFRAQLGVSRMLSSRPSPVDSPGHGLLLVTLDDRPLVVDATMLHGHPLPLEVAEYAHPVWGTQVHQQGDSWLINWKPLGRARLDCQLLALNIPFADFQARHQKSRNTSRFDGALLIRRAGHETLTGIVKGEQVVRAQDGSESFTPLSQSQQHQLLIEHFGIAEEIVARLPADVSHNG